MGELGGQLWSPALMGAPLTDPRFKVRCPGNLGSACEAGGVVAARGTGKLIQSHS